jgi:hypothetical protein
VADLLLRGNAILHPNKGTDGANHEGGASLIKMPDEKLMLADWTSRTGDAFKGKEQANDTFQQGAKAIYAALSAEAGDYTGTYDAKRWKQAIDYATGGIEKHNGSQIVLPYGWTYDQFKDGSARARPRWRSRACRSRRAPTTCAGCRSRTSATAATSSAAAPATSSTRAACR